MYELVRVPGGELEWVRAGERLSGGAGDDLMWWMLMWL